ncbi:hypothetical protein TNIN_27541 [Trichonephila inaurata madagascariensis]|uniref:Uncharacterized protein n=1 Tax=Trichonephila inaurata madagascariensis TaxID=2747483 RepID=A0A8X6YH11_9ARAC|nr:hypothetical protein TNIN_27541 [Trichonephila inaurata madagascariensis]
MKGLSSRKKGSTDVCADGEGAGGRPKGFFLAQVGQAPRRLGQWNFLLFPDAEKESPLYPKKTRCFEDLPQRYSLGGSDSKVVSIRCHGNPGVVTSPSLQLARVNEDAYHVTPLPNDSSFPPPSWHRVIDERSDYIRTRWQKGVPRN